MPTITLKFKDSIIKKYDLPKDGTFNIGRRERNDIVIANLTVSGNHARIDSTDDGYLLTDLKSKNGLYVNDEEFITGYLKDGDVIGIGKHTLVFALDSDDVSEQVENGMDETMVMSNIASKNIINELSQKKGSKRTGCLTFVEGGEGTIELSRRVTKIGKDPSNDIIIYGFMVGRTVATISETPKGYMVTPIGGFTKVKVNNKIVKRPQTLEEFDSIKVGSVELQFYIK